MGLTFPVMAHPALSRQKIRRPVNFQRCQGADPLRPGNGQGPVRSQIRGSLRPRLRQGIYPGQGLPGRFFRTFRCRFFQFRTPEAVAVNEPDEFQPGEQLEKFQPVIGLGNGVLGRKIDRRIDADGSQIIGKIGFFLVRFQFFPQFGPDGRVLQMLVDPVQGAEFQQQVRSRFRSHSGYAGDIVGGIPHQGFQIDDVNGVEAVLRTEFFRVIEGGRGLAGLGNNQLHVHMVIDELQTVPVAGDHHAVPVLLRADPAHGSNHVVGLPTLTFVNGNIHGRQDLLHHRHLHDQFLRHGVPGGLVAVILQVPEGGGVHVKGHADSLRLLLPLHFFQNIQEAVNGVGVQAIPGGQGSDPEIRPVDDAVPIQNHQLHTFLHFAP